MRHRNQRTDGGGEMYCGACGKEVPEAACFCSGCGAPVSPSECADADALIAPAGTRTFMSSTPPEGGSPGGLGGFDPTPPGGKGRRPIWIALVGLAVVVIAAAIAVPLILTRGGDDEVAATSTISTISTTTTESASTTESVNTTKSEASSTSTSVPGEAGLPGDSAGKWVEMDISGAPSSVVAVAVSDGWLLMQAQKDSGSGLYAYNFHAGKSYELPVGAAEVGSIDVDGADAVWWEGTYDGVSGSYGDQHIYSYELPDGPKIEIAGGGKDVSYPQTGGIWVTWVERSPWDADPEEYSRMSIYECSRPRGSETAGAPVEVVPSAVAPTMGDAPWTYSVEFQYLAWEDAAAPGNPGTGTYVLDLMDLSAGPRLISADAWRPSVSGNSLVYWENGLEFLDLKTGEKREIDPDGDYPTAAPTFAAYYRTVESDDGPAYQIVARGLTGGNEQVLAKQTDAPWLSPSISAGSRHIAFITDGALHVFEWQGQ